jgi:hypothetical protein
MYRHTGTLERHRRLLRYRDFFADGRRIPPAVQRGNAAPTRKVDGAPETLAPEAEASARCAQRQPRVVYRTTMTAFQL